jgi:hypothetical protein
MWFLFDKFIMTLTQSTDTEIITCVSLTRIYYKAIEEKF